MRLFLLIFASLIVKFQASCWDPPCSCCKSGRCTISGDICTGCIGDRSFGDKCQDPCPVNCLTCSQNFTNDHNCYTCKNGFYNGQPNDIRTHPLVKNCALPCQEGCEICDSYFNCSKCKNEYFMSVGKNCTKCNSTRTCHICPNGYSLINRQCFSEMVPPDILRTSSSKANIGLIVGLVIGSIAIICVSSIGVILVSFLTEAECLPVVDGWQKRRSTKRRQSRRISGDTEKTPSTNDEENIELLSRETGRTAESKELPSAEKLAVLQMQETFSAIEKKYDAMKIKIDGNKVTVEGDHNDIENAFREISSEYNEIEHFQLKHNKSREWLIFYQNNLTVAYVKQKLKQKQLLGIWNINGTEMTVFVHGKGKGVDFIKILFESVLEISEKVNASLLSSEWCSEFVIDIRSIFHEKVVIFTQEQQNMVIICTDDVVKQVTQMVNEFLIAIEDSIKCEPCVCEFVSKYWTNDDFDDIRINGVKIKTEENKIWVRGLQENVDKAKKKLKMKLKDICSKQKVLEGTGIITVLEAAKQSGIISDIEMDYRCVIKLQQEIDECPSVMLDDYEFIDSQLLEEKHQESCTNTSIISFQTRRHKIKIQLIQGDIVHQEADIVVVGAASILDLQSGSAFDFLLEKGGPKLKTDYNRRYPNGIQNGEVAVINSGNFKCDKIYVTSLPPWKEASHNGGKVLRNFMRECLRLADKYDKTTIAFSIKVTWEKLGYPMDIVVSIMYGAVAEFDCSYSKTSLKEIIIVDDEDTIKIYLMCNLKRHEKDTRTNRIFIPDGTILTKPYEQSKYRMVKDGCEIGPIQLKVHIGNLLNYSADVIIMGTGANTETKGDKHVLEKYSVVIQESTGVKAKYVIQVLIPETLAGWRRLLVRCLEESGKKDIKYVALPVLGSGDEPQTFTADGIGACLFAAIDDFTSQNPASSVTDVRLVVPESYAGCIPAIIAALQDRITDVNSQHVIRKLFKSQLDFVAESGIFKESSVTVCSDSTSNLDRCVKALVDRIGLVFAQKMVDVDKDVITSLNDKQINNLIDSDVLVDVVYNKRTGQFTICGPLRNVLAAITCLHNKLRRCKLEENNWQSSEKLYDQIRWHWVYENQMASETWNPYDIMTNLYIETAYKAGSITLELQSKDGKIYVIDFQKLVEYLRVNIHDTVMVIRKDLKPGKFTDLQLDVKKWLSKSTAMSNNENVTRVVLVNGEEYEEVEKHFFNEQRYDLDFSRSVQVVKIERIQNKTIYEEYKAMKKIMKQQIGRELWHETAEDNIQWIINNGFNRSYCRFHGVLYGQGVYFAADPSTAAQSFLAGNKPGAKRYMFLTTVLTGEIIKGNPSMRVHPLVDSYHPYVVYDSAVDDVNNPTQFVIFHNKQAYPEYLITFTST